MLTSGGRVAARRALSSSKLVRSAAARGFSSKRCDVTAPVRGLLVQRPPTSVLCSTRGFCVNLLSEADFHRESDETLEVISEWFETLAETDSNLDADVNYTNGVLKFALEKHGTYVINKQTPNRQIWLSSPKSGAKRYDLVQRVLKESVGPNNNKVVEKRWVYKHDGVELMQLLEEEMDSIFSN